MSGEMVEKYNKFLNDSGFPPFERKTDDVLYRSTNPITLDSIAEINPEPIKNILEIGRSNGYSYGFFRFCFPKAKVVSIDIVRTPTSVKISKIFDDNFVFIDGTSDTLKDMSIKFDLVFIDGEHTFDWAKKDWDNVQDHLADNAVIVFDDLDWGDWGVNRFFQSLNEKKVTKLIDGSPSYGLVYRGQN